MKDRLQFRHHTSIFENRDEAVRYVMNDVRNSDDGLVASDNSHGMSLYAEPTVLRYKNEEDPSNPHVILAIGAETNEGTQYNDNRYTIIDTHKTESELEEIHDDIEKILRTTKIITKDTDTLKLYSEKTDDGTIISGDVAVAESQILNDIRKPNIILETSDGLFTYIDLDYDINSHILSFTVNGDTKDFDLGIENFYVEKGYYDRKDESIHLLRNDKKEIVINVEELIDEWDVEGEASDTPIILTKEEVGYGNEYHNHVEPWQDLLKADIRLLDSKRNILKKTIDGRYLFVDGTAGNITYFKDGKEMSVQDAIDEFTLDVSPDNSNIIYKKTDGIYSSASLKYVSKSNQLVFTTSNATGGTTEEKIQLNSVELFKDIVYDPTTEELVIMYTDSNDTAQTTRIPIGQMMKDWEWDIQNDGHNVKLHKTRNVNGNDKVSADVDIFKGNNNILEDVNHQLYVRGEADNIKYGNDGNVSDELDKLNSDLNTTNSNLEQESERAKEEETRIEKKFDEALGEGFDIRNSVRDAIDKEISDRKNADDKLQQEVDALSADTASRLIDVINKDKSINVNREDPIRPEVSVNLSNEVENGRSNIIKLNADGIYASANLSYKYDDGNGRSILTFETTTGKTEIELKAPSIIEGIEYDPVEESLLIRYYVDGKLETTRVPLRDLIDEWTTSDNTSGAIRLVKEPDKTHGKDLLWGEVLIDEGRPDNILKKENGVLYVSNTAITQNAKDIDALEESRLTTITSTGNTMLVDGGHTSTGLTPDLAVQISEKGALGTNIVQPGESLGNLLDVTNDGLYVNVDVECIPGDNKNTLVFKTTKGEKRLDLVANADIRELKYNKVTEELELTFGVNSDNPDEKTKTIYCNVRDLIDEWDVDSPIDNAVVLTKTPNHGYDTTTVGPDILTADVKISAAPSNILQKLGTDSPYGGGTLFVDGTQISANTESIEKSKADITGLTDRVGTLETNVTQLQTDLNSEITRAIEKDSQLEGWINDERSARKDADDKLQTDVTALKTALDTEKEDRANADRQLTSDIEAEANRATQAENSLAQDIRDEATNRQASDSVLETKIATEADNRRNADDAIKELLEAEKTRATARENEIEGTLTTKIEDEITRSTVADNELKDKINEADSRLTKGLSDETLRATEAEKNERIRATEAERELSEKLTSEITRSTSKDESLEKAINDEISRSKEAEKGLTEKLTAIDFVFDDTKTIDLNRATESTPNVITANLLISSSDKNIIVTENDKAGVFATVGIEYDKNTNFLKLTGPNGMVLSDIELGQGSLIKKIEYDAKEKALILTYTPAGSDRDEQTAFPVAELFNEWDVKNLTEGSALELTKIPNTTETGTVDLIQGRVLLAGEYNEEGLFDYGDNMIRIVNNGLYVSGTDVKEAKEIADCTSKALKSVVKSVFGNNVGIDIDPKEGDCGASFKYVPPVGDTYEIIQNTTNIEEVLEILVQKHNENKKNIEKVEGDLETVSGNTECVTKEVHSLERNVLGVDVSTECGTDLTYKPNESSCFISAATSMNRADILLDAAICSASTALECTRQELKAVEKVLKGTLTGTCDSGDIEILYPSSKGCLLSGATSYADADLILEEAVCMLMKMMVGSDTASANMEVIQEGMNQWFEVNVRLSHGNGRAQEGGDGGEGYKTYWQSDSDLYINNYVGNIIEPGYKEFSDTNVLRIVDLTDEETSLGYKPTSWFNGVYLSNYWNCGKYYQVKSEQAEIDMMKSEGYTNYDKDLTDESPLEENLFHQRYRNFVKK